MICDYIKTTIYQEINQIFIQMVEHEEFIHFDGSIVYGIQILYSKQSTDHCNKIIYSGRSPNCYNQVCLTAELLPDELITFSIPINKQIIHLS